jgi:hypothetical protein
MWDMIKVYIKCNERRREAAALYARRYPERRQPYRNFFERLKLRLQTHGQFRPIKPAGTYL